MQNILEDSKLYLKSFYTTSGGWVEDPQIKVGGKPVEEEVVSFLSEYFHFILESSMLADVVKEYLKSDYPSRRAFASGIMSGDAEEPNFNTTMSLLTYGKNKMEKAFGNDFIIDVLRNPDKIEEGRKAILEASLTYDRELNNKYRDALSIRIPGTKVIKKEIDDDVFDMFLSIIEPYTKIKMKMVPKYITEDMVGYFNYLSLERGLSDEDAERLKMLKVMLFGIEK